MKMSNELKKGMIIEIKKFYGFEKAIVLRVGKERIDLYRIEEPVKEETFTAHFPPMSIQIVQTPVTAVQRTLLQGWTIQTQIGLGVANPKGVASINLNGDGFQLKGNFIDANVFFIKRTEKTPKIIGSLTKEEQLTHEARAVRISAIGKYRPIKKNPFWALAEKHAPNPCGEIPISPLR